MKVKILSLLLSVTLFFFAAVPARASGSEDLGWIDIFDYALPNTYGNVLHSVPANSYRDLTFSMGVSFRCYEIDILCQLNNVSSVSWTNGSVTIPFTISNISGNIYRLSANLNARQLANFSLRFTNTTATVGTLNLVSFRVNTFSTISFPETAKAVLETQNYSATINYNPDDSINGRSWTGHNDYSELWGDVSITVPDWRLYDYIDIRMTFTCSEIVSISCFMGDFIVPFDQSTILSTSNSKSDFFVTVRIDLRSLSRLSTEDPVLVISFVNTFELSNQFHISSLVGLIDTEIYNPVILWMQKIHAQLDSLADPIVSKLDSVIAAIKGDSSSGDSFQESVEDEINELDQAADIMDSVSRPDINGIDISMDQYASAADLAVLTAPVSLFFEIDLFKSILIMSILFATVSFVLFGKR